MPLFLYSFFKDVNQRIKFYRYKINFFQIVFKIDVIHYSNCEIQIGTKNTASSQAFWNRYRIYFYLKHLILRFFLAYLQSCTGNIISIKIASFFSLPNWRRTVLSLTSLPQDYFLKILVLDSIKGKRNPMKRTFAFYISSTGPVIFYIISTGPVIFYISSTGPVIFYISSTGPVIFYIWKLNTILSVL